MGGQQAKYKGSSWKMSHVQLTRASKHPPAASGRPRKVQGVRSACRASGASVFTAPAPEVFISHLLCLAQMVDSAGLFLLFFYVKGYFEPCFFHVQTPLIVSAVPE